MERSDCRMTVGQFETDVEAEIREYWLLANLYGAEAARTICEAADEGVRERAALPAAA